MPGQGAIERGEVASNVIPFEGRQTADQTLLPPVPKPRSINPQVSDFNRGLRRDYLLHQSQARECFPDGEQRIKPKVLHPGVESGVAMYARAREDLETFFGGVGVDTEELDPLFDSRGNWIYRPNPDITGLSPDAVNGIMRATLQPIHNIVDRSLDGTNPLGFNRHDNEHSEFVVFNGRSLVRKVKHSLASVNDRREINLAIGGQGHDIGNLFGREAHPFISERMMRAIAPSLAEDAENWEVIKRMIVLHDSDNLHAVTGIWGDIGSDKRLERLAEFMKPEGLAHLVADKADIRIQRVSLNLLPGDIQDDTHALVNALLQTVSLDVDGDKFVWRIDYSPEYTHDQVSRYEHVIDGIKSRMDSGELDLNFDKLTDMATEIYSERFVTAAEALLALFPVRNFEIQFVDGPENDLRRVIPFGRKTLDSDISSLREKAQELKKSLG